MISSQDISRIHQSSRRLCDLEDCIKGSWRLGDLASVLQFVTAFVREMRA